VPRHRFQWTEAIRSTRVRQFAICKEEKLAKELLFAKKGEEFFSKFHRRLATPQPSSTSVCWEDLRASFLAAGHSEAARAFFRQTHKFNSHSKVRKFTANGSSSPSARKPWHGPLPKPRISPSLTIGDIIERAGDLENRASKVTVLPSSQSDPTLPPFPKFTQFELAQLRKGLNQNGPGYHSRGLLSKTWSARNPGMYALRLRVYVRPKSSVHSSQLHLHQPPFQIFTSPSRSYAQALMDGRGAVRDGKAMAWKEVDRRRHPRIEVKTEQLHLRGHRLSRGRGPSEDRGRRTWRSRGGRYGGRPFHGAFRAPQDFAESSEGADPELERKQRRSVRLLMVLLLMIKERNAKKSCAAKFVKWITLHRSVRRSMALNHTLFYVVLQEAIRVSSKFPQVEPRA
jgi:hypothetical protein